MSHRSSWYEWHDRYDDPESPLSIRLGLVQEETRLAIDRCPSTPIHLVSICAGQGRDIVKALESHPRQAAVSAVLLELDPRNVDIARRSASAAHLPDVTVVQADASLTDAYTKYVPADVLLICGVFGNISTTDIHRTIHHLPHLCGPGASVIWTRNRGHPDVTPMIRDWFRDSGFDELAFRTVAPGATTFLESVGVHQLAVPPEPHELGLRLFTFFERHHQAAPDRLPGAGRPLADLSR